MMLQICNIITWLDIVSYSRIITMIYQDAMTSVEELRIGWVCLERRG